MLVHSFHPLLPVSGTGTGFDPLPSRERGILSVGVVLFTLTPPCGFPPTRNELAPRS